MGQIKEDVMDAMKPICEIDVDGNKYWHLNGKQHREDGPAVEYADGSKYWYINGEIHRIDGPAIEYANGNKFWYFNDKLHRIDGPAIEYNNGSKFYYLNGIRYSFEEWDRLRKLLWML
jgi:hypothetical protein